MPLPLLELPPELLIQILASLPISPLLKFAQTSRYARNLAYSNLHSLSLAISSSRRPTWYEKLVPLPVDSLPPSRIDCEPHKILVRIPQAWNFSYPTLFNFHNKIITSVLNRHATTLKTLELSLWTLSTSVAQALADLPALRELKIKVENLHPVPRAQLNLQRKQEREAWDILSQSAIWPPRIQHLRIENAEITSTQISTLLTKTTQCAGLELIRCDMLTNALFDSLNSPTCAKVQHSLESLGVIHCGNVHLNQTALEVISKMHRLQTLDLHGCSGLDGEVLDAWNRESWHIAVFVAPRRTADKENLFIEVDPEYVLGEWD
ncbi:hypothetical protein N0V94_000669 [Neodidymelliopsis sp. IMI 364377]|nr:hypothetical protein N0V94_000669 [Neodidymelliopsis sp. IMI 364377]